MNLERPKTNEHWNRTYQNAWDSQRSYERKYTVISAYIKKKKRLYKQLKFTLQEFIKNKSSSKLVKGRNNKKSEKYKWNRE